MYYKKLDIYEAAMLYKWGVTLRQLSIRFNLATSTILRRFKENKNELERKGYILKNIVKRRGEWHRGKTKKTDERLFKRAEKIRKHYKIYSVWNYGLTKETDKRVAKYGKDKIRNARISASITGLKRVHSKEARRKMAISTAKSLAKRAKHSSTYYDTDIEIMFEKKVLKNLLPVYKYKKQYRIGRYVVDFYIPKLNLVLECYGDYWHGKKKENKDSWFAVIKRKRDKGRVQYIRNKGYTVLRLWGSMIKEIKIKNGMFA